MFFKIGIPKNFANFMGKYLTPTQVFPYVIYELFKNTFFYRTPPVAASENNEQLQLSEGFVNSCYKIVSPILTELINYFVVCKPCSGTLLLVKDITNSHGFGN